MDRKIVRIREIPQVLSTVYPRIVRIEERETRNVTRPHEGILTQKFQTTFIILLDDLNTNDDVKSFS